MLKPRLFHLFYVLVLVCANAAYASSQSKTIFAHFDIEADGADVMHSNMVSLGISFTDASGHEISSFLGDLEPLPGHSADQKTLDWWNGNESNRKELARIKANAKPARQVMADLAAHLDRLTLYKGDDGSVQRQRVIWLARPASFDYSWLYAYYMDYLRSLPPSAQSQTIQLHFAATCVSTMRDVYQLMHNLSRQEMDAKVKQWTAGLAVTHNPLDDCRYQARLYFALCRELGLDTNKL